MPDAPLDIRLPPTGGVLAHTPFFASSVPPRPRLGAGAPGWFASAALLATLLDAAGVPGPAGPVRWLEAAALAGLLAGFAIRGRARDPGAWNTPLDGRIVAALVVWLIAALPAAGDEAGRAQGRIVLAGVAAYYALAALVAGDREASEVAWRAFPAAATALGLHALWAATSGLAPLAAAAAAADSAWGARHALALALLLATLLTLGRATERGAAPGWRLAAVVGAIGTALHLAATPWNFDATAMARLEEPFGFSAAIVLALVLHGLARMAWGRGRERSPEAGRWWGAVAAVAALGGSLLFGPCPPGEGPVVLASLAAALVAAAPAAGAAAPGLAAAGPPARLPRAA